MIPTKIETDVRAVHPTEHLRCTMIGSRRLAASNVTCHAYVGLGCLSG